MSTYKHIIAAIDVTDEAHIIIQKGKQIAQAFNAKLSVVHVCEPIPLALGEYLTIYLPADTKSLHDHIQKSINAIVEENNIPEEDVYIVNGKTAETLIDLSQTIKADLIITGSHSNTGIMRLLGSTANDILHQSTCDIVTIKINEE